MIQRARDHFWQPTGRVGVGFEREPCFSTRSNHASKRRKTLQNDTMERMCLEISILRMKSEDFLRFAVGIYYTFAIKRDGIEMGKKDVRC
jgi:hypothetical protein